MNYEVIGAITKNKNFCYGKEREYIHTVENLETQSRIKQAKSYQDFYHTKITTFFFFFGLFIPDFTSVWHVCKLESCSIYNFVVILIYCFVYCLHTVNIYVLIYYIFMPLNIFSKLNIIVIIYLTIYLLLDLIWTFGILMTKSHLVFISSFTFRSPIHLQISSFV